MSEQVAAVWRRTGSRRDPVDRVHVVGPTVTFGPHRPDQGADRSVRSLLELGDADPLLVSVGRLIESKNHAVLVPMMLEVIERHPRAALMIVGSGVLHDPIAELVQRAGIEAHIKLMGSRDDISALLAASDLFVFPSLTEGLGVAVVEAVAAGLPVVAYDLPPLRDMVTDGRNGVIATPIGDPIAFTEATLSALDNLSTHQEWATLMWDQLRDRFDNTASANDELDRTYLAARSATGGLIARPLPTTASHRVEG